LQQEDDCQNTPAVTNVV